MLIHLNTLIIWTQMNPGERKQINHSLKWRFNKNNSAVISHMLFFSPYSCFCLLLTTHNDDASKKDFSTRWWWWETRSRKKKIIVGSALNVEGKKEGIYLYQLLSDEVENNALAAINACKNKSKYKCRA